MKKIIISLILVFALTGQAFAMGWFGGGGGGGSSAAVSGSGKSISNTNSNSNSSGNASSNNTGGGNNSSGGALALVAGPNATGSDPGTVPTPELSTIFLLGSALIGILGLRKRIKK